MTQKILGASLLMALAACTGPKPDTGDCIVGCGDSDSQLELAPAPDLTGLVDASGCADLMMALGDPSGELVLVFSYDGALAQQAFESGTGAASAALDLASQGSLELWQGSSVTNLPCNDALTGDEEVLRSWLTVSGSAALTVTSDGVHEPWDAYPGTADLELSDVVLSSEGAEDVVIESLGWSAYVGWLPG